MPIKDDKQKEYLRYSGLGFQMITIILVGIFLGMGLDKWLKTEKPYFSAGCSVLFVFLALYIVIRDIIKK